MSAPGQPGFAFLDGGRPLAFAHRGGAADGLENSMAAFARAVDLGYRYLETDVHATADGVLLAFHDHTLDRVTDARGEVARLPWREVRRARIGGEEPIPRLEDLLGAWPDVRVNVDVKDPASVSPLVEVIRRTAALDRVCVASFGARRLAQVRRLLGPRLCTALAPPAAALLRLAATGGPLARLAPRSAPCAQLPPRLGPLTVLTPGLVTVAHRHGMRVHAWTVNERAEMTRLLDLGVDGIITDEIITLRDLLVTSGLWRG